MLKASNEPVFHPPLYIRCSVSSTFRGGSIKRICSSKPTSTCIWKNTSCSPTLSVRLQAPTNAPTKCLPLTRSFSGVAGIVIAFLLANSTIAPLDLLSENMQQQANSPCSQPAHYETHKLIPPVFSEIVFSPRELPAAEKKALKEQSRKHTRTSGRTAQEFSQARRQEAAGDLDGAMSTYTSIIETAPDFAPAFSNRGNLYAAKRDFNAALHDYDRSLSLAPLSDDSWVVYVNRGCTKLARGDDPYAALADMNVAFELKGKNDVVLANRASVYEALAKYDNAIHDYQAALKSNDVQPFWNRYGLLLFQRNMSTEALSILKRVAARFKVDDVHAAMAIVYFDRGEIGNAEAEWSQLDRPRRFESRSFLEGERKWPPRAVDAMQRFRNLKE